jgi:hypothetical protein
MQVRGIGSSAWRIWSPAPPVHRLSHRASFAGPGERVVGLDNLSSYYSVALKKPAWTSCGSTAGFTFCEVELADPEAIRGAWGPKRSGG